MSTKDTITLTIDQALEAICLDFKQYPPQILLFCEILRLIGGGRIVTQRDPGQDGVWIGLPGDHCMRWLKGPELIDFMCKTLRRTHMDMALTQAVCTRVFQTKADPVPPAGSDQEKICIETGMEEFNCQCCGRCCLTLDYRDQLTTEDVQRWRQIGRTDVINRIGVFLKEGHGPRYRMWVSPHTKEYEKHCPFLKKESSSQRYLCRIHDVKPAICRQYPVSRKHAQMTGCKGFNAINT